MMFYNLRIAWWNTALSPAAPTAKSKANNETYLIICDHIKRVLTEFSCYLVSIFEVSSQDVDYISLNLSNLVLLDLTFTVGRTRFYTAELI